MYNISEIKSKFIDVIKYSQELDKVNVDKLFEKWLSAKHDFITLMGDNLIYELPEKVSFHIEKEEKGRKVDQFLDVIEQRYKNYALSEFINYEVDSFFDNAVNREYEYDGHKIPIGMKLVKAFKFFEKDQKALADLQNLASQVIQEDKIEGKLCISVHPLDYLSISENSYNWRSCHALDGEYRSGNLSYMVDNSTVVVYLKSEKEEQLPNFPFEWNSKKWRVLLYFSNDMNMLMAGRQYPFSCQAAMDKILKELLGKSGLSRKYQSEKWYSDYVNTMGDNGHFWLEDSYYPVGEKLLPLTELVKNNPGSMQFNDLLHSSCYKPMYTFAHTFISIFWDNPTGQTSWERTRFNIGGPVYCVCCGKEQINESEHMVCVDCEEKYGHRDDDDYGYCTCCGRHLHMDDAYWVSDDLLCASCYDSTSGTCDHCGEVVYSSELTYDRETEEYLCRDCKGAY